MIKSVDRCGLASVTFTLPVAVGATRVAVCGEWNGWSSSRDVMRRVGDYFALTVELATGRSYRFRYLLDGERWENDWDADAYAPNPFGGDDSVVDLTAPTGALPASVEDEPGGRSCLPGSVESDSAGEDDPSGLSVEREAKLVAPAGLSLPSLNDLLPGVSAAVLPVRRLDATYYDTADLRLARSGVTLRYRAGESGPAWTVKLPEAGPETELVRREIRVEGPPGLVPVEASDLVLASSRGHALAAVATLSTVRRPIEIRDGDGQLLVEMVDDIVSVSHNQHPTGRFREIEVELYAPGDRGIPILNAAVARLIAAGCAAEPPLPKLVRALGPPATGPPDVVVPPLEPEGTVVDLVRHVTARSVAQIIHHDPGARLGDDPEDVHKLRVATRRLRSDLHSFGALLDGAAIRPIRTELSWLGGVVGAVRDTDVLSARFEARLAALPNMDAEGKDRLRGLLEIEAGEARAAMLGALREDRYLRLLDALVALAAAPPFVTARKLTARSSRRMASKIVRKPWRRVHDAVGALGSNPTDAQLHQVRILAKRSRYAAEAAAPLLDPAATRFAAAVADVQTVLGDHQDTVLAEAWLRSTVASLPGGSETVTRLIAVEQERRAALRAQWPAVWRKARARKLHTWH
jgi:CHAD domain-containing protein